MAAAAAPARRLPEHPQARPARPPVTRRAPRARATAAQRTGLTRLFIIVALCLTTLALGRVALSFAVVQKTLQTDAIVLQERRVTAENGQLTEELARLSSAVRVSGIAERELGYVYATHVQYLSARDGTAAGAGGAER